MQMQKEPTRKEDGRQLIYFTFTNEPTPVQQPAPAEVIVRQRKQSPE